jgi:hypothetical protein
VCLDINRPSHGRSYEPLDFWATLALERVLIYKKTKSQLARAFRNTWLVRFASALDRGTVTSYVLDIGPQFFLLALVTDGIRFDGFHATACQTCGNCRCQTNALLSTKQY